MFLPLLVTSMAVTALETGILALMENGQRKNSDCCDMVKFLSATLQLIGGFVNCNNVADVL